MGILSEITYSNGKLGMEKAKFENTPAKLRLSSNMFRGIHKKVSAKANVEEQLTDFNIPGAYMAMDVGTGEDGGANFSVVASNLENVQMKPDEKSQRLKIKEEQKNQFVSKANPMSTDFSVNAQEFQIGEKDRFATMTSEIKPVAEVAMEKPMEAMTSAIDKLSMDDVMAEDQAEVVFTASGDIVKRAENMEAFKLLQQATMEYEKISGELRDAITDLESEKRALEEAKQAKMDADNNLETEENRVQEIMEMINIHEKETAEIQAKCEEVDRVIKRQLEIINELIQRKRDKKQATDDQTSETKKQKDEEKMATDETRQRVDDLTAKRKDLEAKEREASDTKAQAQEVLKEKEGLCASVQLPTVNKEELLNNAPSIDNSTTMENIPNTGKVINFPGVTSEATPVESEVVVEDGPSMTKSLGVAA